jgi:hypothetical protein
MSTTIDEIYTEVVRRLPPEDRLRLATLILNNLVQQNIGVIDESDTWTEEDVSDLSAFALQYAVTAYTEPEEVT